MNLVSYPRFVVIGVGGGWRTPRDLAFFLWAFMRNAVLLIADGGIYRSNQIDHERFEIVGNKARIQAEYVRTSFPGLQVEDIRSYVDAETHEGVIAGSDLIRSGDVVFLQVDNNVTRRTVLDHCRTLNSATLLCGGTNDDQLRVMVYLRREGRDLAAPFSEYCAEIKTPTDRSPVDRLRPQGCQEEAERGGQQPFTMLSASTFLLNAFYEVWKLESAGRLHEFPYHELWYDIGTGRCRTEKSIPVGSEERW
jgi:molybdopterin/thiamine biosynthesis adenylyltransferase